MSDDIQRATRAATRSRRFPTGAACAGCGERDIRALVAGGRPLLCYACVARREGRTAVEQHHIAGRENVDLTVPIPANDHRVLSDMQQDWPRETLRNPDACPVRAVAALLRGWIDVMKVCIDRAVGWIPDALEALSDALRDVLGPAWWDRPECTPFVAALTSAGVHRG